MKILIVGAGAIGSIYGKVLSEKHQVWHYVRQEKLEQLDHKEIKYDIVDERMKGKDQYTTGTYAYHCVTHADDSYDLIILPVKTHHLLDALKTLALQAPKANYLLFTLDWQNMPAVDQILQKEKYVLGYAGGGGAIKDDLLWANVGKDIMLGVTSPEQMDLMNQTVEMFKACGIIPEIPQNAIHWLWMHNAATAPFGAALAKYNSINQLVDDMVLVKTSFRAMRECYAICAKRGVDLNQFSEVKMYNMPLWIIYMMFRINFKTNPAMKRYTAHAMDCLDEMKQNFMEIYNTGLGYGVAMPNMKVLKDNIA